MVSPASAAEFYRPKRPLNRKDPDSSTLLKGKMVFARGKKTGRGRVVPGTQIYQTRELRFLLLGEKARMRAVFFFSPTIIGFMEGAGSLSATIFGSWRGISGGASVVVESGAHQSSRGYFHRRWERSSLDQGLSSPKDFGRDGHLQAGCCKASTALTVGKALTPRECFDVSANGSKNSRKVTAFYGMKSAALNARWSPVSSKPASLSCLIHISFLMPASGAFGPGKVRPPLICGY